MVADKKQGAANARGYDDPATDDLLDRRPLARAIADVISATPAEFGVRVGLFGEWGSGKSSVLNFIQQILEGSGHVVVRFSPWGIVDRSELWARLGATLVTEFDKRGEPDRGGKLTRFKLKYDKKIRKVLGVGKKLAGDIPRVGHLADALAAPVLASVLDVLTTTERQLASLAQEGERIVVMIDDVDRADPGLVPPMLFALRELFDVPRFSWILAIDPVVVRAALKRYHPGFGLGRDFLEKIVEFPFTLTAPDPARRVELLERELAGSGVLLDNSGLNEIAALLPDNPRELRAIVRHFRSISRTLNRLGPEGFEQRMLLTLVVIHAAAPQMLTRLLDSPKVLAKLTGLKFLDGERAKAAHATAIKKMKPFLSASGLRVHDRNRLRRLLLRLGDGGYWAAETVIETGRLLHTAPIMTSAEAAKGVARSTNASALMWWLDAFAKGEDRPERDVRRAFFDQLLRMYSSCMEAAAGAFAHDDTTTAVQSLLGVIRVLELLLFDLRGATEVGPVGLEAMRQRFSQYAHFRHPEDYIPARSAEKKCLLRFAAHPELDPLEALNHVRPNRLLDDPGPPEGPAWLELNQALLAVLEPRATEAFINALDEENMVSFHRGWKQAGSYLLRSKSRLWTSDVRLQLREMLERERSIARADNAMDLLRVVLAMSEDRKRKILSDVDLVKLLWSAATSIAPNMRRFTSFEELKQEVEQAAGSTLDEPPWWKAKMAQQRAAAQAERSEPSDAESAMPPPESPESKD